MERELWNKPTLSGWENDERKDDYEDSFIGVLQAKDPNRNYAMSWTFVYCPAYGRGVIMSASFFDTKEEAMNEADRLWEALPMWNPN